MSRMALRIDVTPTPLTFTNYGLGTVDDNYDCEDYVLDTFVIEKTSAAAETDEEVEAVEALIEAIGTPITLESETAINAARSAYDALDSDQQAEVSNYDVLVAAEDALEALKEDVEVEVEYVAESVDLTVIAPETAEAGSTITVQIAATTDADTAQLVKALNFELEYDDSMLTFEGIEPAEPFDGELYVVDESDTPKAVFAYADNAANGIDPAKVVKGTPTVVATATFTVGTTLGETEISISDADILLDGDDTYNGYTPDLSAGADTVEIVKSLDIKFIYKEGDTEAESYAVLAEGTKIAVIVSDTNDTTYTYDGKTFYYSEKLGGYAAIVDEDVSAADIMADVTSEDGAAEEIVYDGDVSGDGKVQSGDAAMVSAMLHNPDGAYSDYARLAADVTDGVSYVTTADAMWILKESVGLN